MCYPWQVLLPRFSMCAGDFVELYRRNNNNGSGSNGGDSSSGAATTAMSTDSTPHEGGELEGGGDEEHEDGELWDAVVTCFFVDTAPVVVEYIETIHSMLRPGGVWVRQQPSPIRTPLRTLILPTLILPT